MCGMTQNESTENQNYISEDCPYTIFMAKRSLLGSLKDELLFTICILYCHWPYVVNLVYGCPLVTISCGKLTGKLRETSNGVDYIAFTSIPYAEPPIGKNSWFFK